MNQIMMIPAIEEVEKKDDENIESTLTFDLTISAVTFLDAFGSVEENLCNDESKVLFIGDVPSKAERDEKNEKNTLYTFELRGMDSLGEFFGNF